MEIICNECGRTNTVKGCHGMVYKKCWCCFKNIEEEIATRLGKQI